MSIKTDWSDIKPTVWHNKAFGARLYLFISSSGKTHVAKWIGNIPTTFGHLKDRANYEYITLCNRRFTMYDPETTKRTGWRRPVIFYSIHSHEPDGFLGVDCSRCDKLKPSFNEPLFEIDMRLHESELLLTEKDDEYNHKQETPQFYQDSQLSSNIIPKVLLDPRGRCETCDKICTPDEIDRRQREIIESLHSGWRNPRACKYWQAGVYSKRQDALQFTDEQLESLSRYRLNLIYDYLINAMAWEPSVDASFQIRVLRILKDKE